MALRCFEAAERRGEKRKEKKNGENIRPPHTLINIRIRSEDVQLRGRELQHARLALFGADGGFDDCDLLGGLGGFAFYFGEELVGARGS